MRITGVIGLSFQYHRVSEKFCALVESKTPLSDRCGETRGPQGDRHVAAATASETCGYKKASATESARALPLRVNTKFPFASRSSCSAASSWTSCAKSFSSEEVTP